jgi:uncharacterized membrane protein
MINQLKIQLQANRKTNIFKLLVLSCCFCFTVALIRVFVTDSPAFFLFLHFNLFLASIPLMVSTYLIFNPQKQNNTRTLYFLLSIWLVFFPNALYILTDLYHLKPRAESHIWFDFILLFSFAWTGLIFGIISLMDIESIFVKRIGTTKTNLLIVVLLFACSFGVYLGRFLRWNSWDVIASPFHIMYDISNRILFPFDHTRTWGMTILYGTLFNLIYWTIKFLKNDNRSIVNSKVE